MAIPKIVDLDAPIRVAFCHYTSDPGGGSDRSLFDFVTRLPAHRFTPLMLLHRNDPMIAAYREHGIYTEPFHLVHPQRTRRIAPHARYFTRFWPAVFALEGALLRLRAEAVHANTINNLVAPVAARVTGLPLVWHVRELGSGGRIDRIQRALVARMAARAVAISDAVAETLPGCGDRLRVVPNGIELARFQQGDPAAGATALGVSPGTPIVLCVGRIEPWKGQQVLADAAPAILQAHPDARIIFVGGPAANKPAYAEELRAACTRAGIDHAVHFAGPREDVPDLLAAAAVLVLPTATAEPFGRTLIEAMAAGVPIVATDTGGPLEIVVDNKTGYLVPTEDPPALAERINDLLADPDRARQMGEAGRKRAETHFNIDRVASSMAALFEELTRPRDAGVVPLSA